MIKTYHDCEKAQEYTLPMVAKVKLPVKLDNNQVQCIQHAPDKVLLPHGKLSKSCHQKSLVISAPSVAAAHNTHSLLDNPIFDIPHAH